MGVAPDSFLPGTARHPWRIALISFLILFLELALIRLIPSEIKAISYFTNLLLFSAFFGLGLGCILWKREVSPYLLAAGMAFIFIFVMVSRGITVYETPGEVHYWLQADERFKPFWRMPLVAAAFTVFCIAAIPFVTMGRALAREMQGHPRLTAYAYDLIGSFLGTVAFALLSYLGTPPWALVALTGVTWGLTLCERAPVRLAHVVAALAFLAFAMAPYSWRWSPYYFVQFDVDPNRITVWVNSSFHQEAINFQSTQPEFQPTASRMAEKFALPYREYRRFHDGRAPDKVLILGAGTGNDVNIALRNGVRDVTAVEIDPQIAAIGQDFNPMRPYQDPAVRLVIDDGRHFLSNAKDRYDMVLFGTLDSQTLLAGQANLRLDNYIYTTECFKDARKVLRPGGMLAAYYSVFKPWFFGRIYATVSSAFPGALQMHWMKDNYLFNTTIIAAKEVAGFASDPSLDRHFATAIPSTDNWPYIYLEYPVISNLYLEVLGLIGAMIAVIVIILRKLEKSTLYHLDFFFLGVGFSLMESAAIVRLALAFGSTWVVSAVVFACVLLTVFVANAVMERRPTIPTGAAWVALVAALTINFLFPVQALLELSFPLRVLGATALVGTPVFCAGIAFSSLFRREAEVGAPFGMNMVGAMTGGSIEYLSMLMGMRSIWVVLVIVYSAAFLCHRYKGR